MYCAISHWTLDAPGCRHTRGRREKFLLLFFFFFLLELPRLIVVSIATSERISRRLISRSTYALMRGKKQRSTHAALNLINLMATRTFVERNTERYTRAARIWTGDFRFFFSSNFQTSRSFGVVTFVHRHHDPDSFTIDNLVANTSQTILSYRRTSQFLLAMGY